MENDLILLCAILAITITTLLLLTALACSAYFIFKTMRLWKNHKDSTQKTKQSFLLFNITTVIVFIFAAIFIWIECWSTIIAKPYDFFSHFGTKIDNVIILLYFAMLLYLFGKYCLYFILYLRLKLVLHDSIFAFEPVQYKIIQSIIWLGILFSLLSALVASVPLTTTMVYTARVVLYSTYLLLDLLTPIWLNTMFVIKYLQIGKFLQDTRNQLSVGQKSHVKVSPNINRTSIKSHTSEKKTSKPSKNVTNQKLTMLSVGSSSGSHDKNTTINIHESRQSANNNIDNDNSSKNNNDRNNDTTDNSNINNAINNHNNGNSNDNISVNRKLLEKLSRFTVLSILVAISTMSVIIGLIIQTVWYINLDNSETIKEPGFGWLLLLFDSCINAICLVLYFPISKWIMEKYLCCHNQLQLKCLLKCIKNDDNL